MLNAEMITEQEFLNKLYEICDYVKRVNSKSKTKDTYKIII